MNPFFKTILCLGMTGAFFSCKASTPSTAIKAQKDQPLQAKIFMAPFEETSAEDSVNAEVVNLQAALAMYKLANLRWPENKVELNQMIGEDDSSLELDRFTTLNWTASGDTLRVSYDIYISRPETSEATLQEGKFDLFVSEDTIRVGDFTYKNHESLIILPKDSIE